MDDLQDIVNDTGKHLVIFGEKLQKSNSVYDLEFAIEFLELNVDTLKSIKRTIEMRNS